MLGFAGGYSVEVRSLLHHARRDEKRSRVIKFMVVVAMPWALTFVLLHTVGKADWALLKTFGVSLGLAVLAGAARRFVHGRRGLRLGRDCIDIALPEGAVDKLQGDGA